MQSTVIIGGGAVGLSLAFHLSQRGHDNVALLERNTIGSGTSWHAAGIVGPLRATPNMTRLAMYAAECFPKLEQLTGLTTGFRQTGGYWLARRPERMDELHRIAAVGSHFGLQVEVLGPEDTQRQLPYLNIENYAGSLRVTEDASVNPVDLCAAYARAAQSFGADIRENTSVSRILSNNGRVAGVELQCGQTIEASQVALCCGAWSKPLARQVGLALPIQAVEHMYVVTEPVPNTPDPFPVIRDLDAGIYLKGDTAGKLVLGGFEPNAKCWDAFGSNGNVPFLELPEDWEQFAPFMESAMTLCPALESVGVQHFMNGPESFTADTRPLIGEAPSLNGLFVAAGMNSVGLMSSAGVGRILADWMIDGAAPTDLWEVDIARVDPLTADDVYMEKRMTEAVADQFDMHWPYKQPEAGRPLRLSPLHEKWQNQGAVFGYTAGWERALWYAQTEAEKALPYSVGPQPWQPLAEREARTLDDGTVLIDLTPFSKFDITGVDALAFVNYIACANMNVDIGRVVYTPLLNKSGGIEADVTICRVDEHQFRLTSGAATRWRDEALLLKHSTQFSVSIVDVTELEAVIGVMGQGSRDLMQKLTDQDMNSFPFSTARTLSINSIVLWASRVSFAGELGWELTIPNSEAHVVFDSLVTAGAEPMGHYALESCRIEKGFRHWGHDLGPELTPLQTGLEFTIDWQKEFIGKDALVTQREFGFTSRLCLFQVQGRPLILHDEPIHENRKVVGLTTSGTHGVRTGLTLAFGLIEVGSSESLQDTAKRIFEIEVAGEVYPAKVLTRAPYDPSGSRMRS